MANWYYYDDIGQKQGPIDVTQLKMLALHGIITPETIIENGHGHSRKAGEVNGLCPTPASIPPNISEPNSFNSSTPSSTESLQYSPMNNFQLIGFLAKPFLKWLLDIQFKLCYFFTFAKRIVQIIYLLCIVAGIVGFLVGTVINLGSAWSDYHYSSDRIKVEIKGLKNMEQSNKKELKDCEKEQKELKGKLERAQGKNKLEIEDKLNEIKQKLVNIQSNIKTIQTNLISAKNSYPSFLPYIPRILFVAICTLIGIILSLLLVRLFCEFILFILDWCVDTRQAAQHIIANNQHTT
jgi:hypothetical protein